MSVSEGHNERLFSLISELVALDPDVIVAVGAPPTDAARRATSTVPIVMWGTNDPVGAGFIKSLAHPGGNEQAFREPRHGTKGLLLLIPAFQMIAGRPAPIFPRWIAGRAVPTRHHSRIG